MKPIITIIGSITKSKEDIQKAEDFFKALGFYVIDPLTNNNESIPADTLYDIQFRYIGYIMNSNCICVVRKEDGSIGESTSYELAMADYFKKPVILWDGGGELYDEKAKIIRLDGV